MQNFDQVQNHGNFFVVNNKSFNSVGRFLSLYRKPNRRLQFGLYGSNFNQIPNDPTIFTLSAIKEIMSSHTKLMRKNKYDFNTVMKYQQELTVRGKRYYFEWVGNSSQSAGFSFFFIQSRFKRKKSASIKNNEQITNRRSIKAMEASLGKLSISFC